MSDHFLTCFSCVESDEPMDMSVMPEEGGQTFQKLQDDEALEIEKPLLPPQPAVSPQVSTPVSQSTPVFTPGSLPIPSQPEFSHVSVVGKLPSDAFASPPYFCF